MPKSEEDDAAGSVLAGQHADAQEDQQQRRIELGGQQPCKNAGKPESAAKEHKIMRIIHGATVAWRRARMNPAAAWPVASE
ncbi:MAG: hypothetical protein WDN49_20375 [Acetobacteraceae bacterium]